MSTKTTTAKVAVAAGMLTKTPAGKHGDLELRHRRHARVEHPSRRGHRDA